MSIDRYEIRYNCEQTDKATAHGEGCLNTFQETFKEHASEVNEQGGTLIILVNSDTSCGYSFKGISDDLRHKIAHH